MPGGIICSIWSSCTRGERGQARRPLVASLPLRTSDSQCGQVARGFQWVIAVLMLHRGAVVKRHVADRDTTAVRRMLR